MSNAETNEYKSPRTLLEEVEYRAQQDCLRRKLRRTFETWAFPTEPLKAEELPRLQDCLRRQKVFTEKRKDLKFLTRAQFDAKWGS